ncbi:MAG TPA: ABC transporter permease [Steroidobacteraceae bacterium]|nr:ABC transporter permease [Steroidobacteraceae bacterium]
MDALTTPLDSDHLMPLGRVLRAYLKESRSQFIQALRAPAFAFPFLLLPVPLYLFFGVVMAGNSREVIANPVLLNYSFCGWCCMAVMGPAIFGIGCGLAMERDANLLKLKRALPLPAGSYLIAKMIMSIAFAAISVGLVTIAGLAAKTLHLAPGALLAMDSVLVLGAIPFCAIGLFIGAFSSASAAPAYANLIYLPGLWLSGMFFPLPKFLQPWSVIWPAFHLNMTALAAGGNQVPVSPLMTSAVLVGISVLFGGLAIRRLARRE